MKLGAQKIAGKSTCAKCMEQDSQQSLPAAAQHPQDISTLGHLYYKGLQ